MFESVKRLFQAGRLSETGVRTAVDRGWITAAQAAEILGSE